MPEETRKMSREATMETKARREPMTEPSEGARRAAEIIIKSLAGGGIILARDVTDAMAEIIDRETHSAEMRKALEAMIALAAMGEIPAKITLDRYRKLLNGEQVDGFWHGTVHTNPCPKCGRTEIHKLCSDLPPALKGGAL